MPKDNTTTVNEEAASSAASSQQQTTNAETSSTVQGEEQTLADVAREAYEAATSSEEVEPQEETDETTTEEAPPQEEQEEQPKVDETVLKEPEPKKDESTEEQPKESARSESIPRQRFDEVNTKFIATEAKVKELQPLADSWNYHQSFIQQHNISNEEVQTVMNYLMLKKSDPEKAYAIIKAEADQMKQYDENYIPPDLAARAEQGEWGDHSSAVVKELAKLRREADRGKAAEKRSTATVQAMNTQAINNTLASWDSSKRATDLGFKPKANEQAPDGLWEITAAKFAYLQTLNFASTPQEVTASLEKAYKEAKASLAAVRGKPAPTRPVLKTSRSSTTLTNGTPKSIDDVVALTARQHGINWSGRSNGHNEED